MTLLEKTGTPIGSYAPDLELPGIDNQVHHLRRYLEKYGTVAVILMSNHSPYALSYLGRLKTIQSEFEKQGFTLIGINAIDTLEAMKTFARECHLNFTYLWDSTQEVTRSFGAEKIPMAFLIDGDGIVRYKGQIDDNPEEPEAVQKHYLRNAIAALLQGKAINPKETQPIGTSLTWH